MILCTYFYPTIHFWSHLVSLIDPPSWFGLECFSNNLNPLSISGQNIQIFFKGYRKFLFNLTLCYLLTNWTNQWTCVHISIIFSTFYNICNPILQTIVLKEASLKTLLQTPCNIYVLGTNKHSLFEVVTRWCPVNSDLHWS